MSSSDNQTESTGILGSIATLASSVIGTAKDTITHAVEIAENLKENVSQIYPENSQKEIIDINFKVGETASTLTENVKEGVYNTVSSFETAAEDVAFNLKEQVAVTLLTAEDKLINASHIATEKASELKTEATVTAHNASVIANEKMEEAKETATDMMNTVANSSIGTKVSEVKEATTEQVGKMSEVVSEKLHTVSDIASDKIESAKQTASEVAASVQDKGIIETTQEMLSEAVETTKETINVVKQQVSIFTYENTPTEIKCFLQID